MGWKTYMYNVWYNFRALLYLVKMWDEMCSHSDCDQLYPVENNWNWDSESRCCAKGFRQLFASFEHYVDWQHNSMYTYAQAKKLAADLESDETMPHRIRACQIADPSDCWKVTVTIPFLDSVINEFAIDKICNWQKSSLWANCSCTASYCWKEWLRWNSTNLDLKVEASSTNTR